MGSLVGKSTVEHSKESKMGTSAITKDTTESSSKGYNKKNLKEGEYEMLMATPKALR